MSLNQLPNQPNKGHLSSDDFSGLKNIKQASNEIVGPKTISVLEENSDFIVNIQGAPYPYDEILQILNNKRIKVLKGDSELIEDKGNKPAEYSFEYREQLIHFVIEEYEKYLNDPNEFDIDKFTIHIPRHQNLRERSETLFRGHRNFASIVEARNINNNRERVKTVTCPKRPDNAIINDFFEH